MAALTSIKRRLIGNDLPSTYQNTLLSNLEQRVNAQFIKICPYLTINELLNIGSLNRNFSQLIAPHMQLIAPHMISTYLNRTVSPDGILESLDIFQRKLIQYCLHSKTSPLELIIQTLADTTDVSPILDILITRFPFTLKSIELCFKHKILIRRTWFNFTTTALTPTQAIIDWYYTHPYLGFSSTICQDAEIRAWFAKDNLKPSNLALIRTYLSWGLCSNLTFSEALNRILMEMPTYNSETRFILEVIDRIDCVPAERRQELSEFHPNESTMMSYFIDLFIEQRKECFGSYHKDPADLLMAYAKRSGLTLTPQMIEEQLKDSNVGEKDQTIGWLKRLHSVITKQTLTIIVDSPQ